MKSDRACGARLQLLPLTCQPRARPTTYTYTCQERGKMILSHNIFVTTLQTCFSVMKKYHSKVSWNILPLSNSGLKTLAFPKLFPLFKVMGDFLEKTGFRAVFFRFISCCVAIFAPISVKFLLQGLNWFFRTPYLIKKIILTNCSSVNDPPILTKKQPKAAIFAKLTFGA